MQAYRFWLLAATLALLGCEAEKISIDRFGRSSEPTPAREALTLHEISFMVRMHSPEVEIIDAVQKRGLAEALDEREALALAEVGASKNLIKDLKTSKYVLTKAELALYLERMENRNAAANMARQSQEEWRAGYAATITSQIEKTEREVRERRIEELTTEIKRLEKDKRRENYSLTYFSPYQGFQRKIDKAEEEISSLRTVNDKIAKRAQPSQGTTGAR